MRQINRAENWERAYEAFQQINFSAWDYNTIKESLLDYLKLYYPEDFNDYTENSDLIAVLELFAYIGELGLGPVKLYGSYSITPLHQYGVDLRPNTIGIRFSSF